MRTILSFVFITLISCAAMAQLSKEEKKEWSKKMKELTPEAYKAMVEEHDKYKNDNATLNSEVANLKADNEKLQSDINDYKAIAEAAEKAKKEAEQLQQELAAKAAADSAHTGTHAAPVASDGGPAPKAARPSTGVVFKVQVGAFKSFDLTKYFNKHQNFSGDVDEDGTMKYTLGVFNEYWEADKFKKYMRDMGIKGAWVVAYKNGKRVNIKDVLEGAI